MAHKSMSCEKRYHFLQTIGNCPPDQILFCPIDISKHFHLALLHDIQCQVVADFFPFSASKSGFEQFGEYLASGIRQIKARQVFIGMEPTGIYYESLLAGLYRQYAHQTQPAVHLCLVNPSAVEANRTQHSLRVRKSDYLDVAAIGELLTRGLYAPARLPPPDLLLLKELVRSFHAHHRHFLAWWNRLLSRLERVFPNLFVKYNEDLPLCQNPLDSVLLDDILHLCPNPYDLLPLSPQDLISLFHRHHRPLGPVKSRRLLALAQRSLVLPQPQQQVHCSLLQTELATVDFFKSQLATLTSQLDHLFARSPARHLAAISGSSQLLAATFVAALQDWHRFDRVQQVWACAGLHPRLSQSGASAAPPTLSKSGSSQLRQAIYRLTCSLIWHEPTFGIPCFERLLALRPFVPSVIHTARKVTATALALLSSDRPFVPPFSDYPAAKAHLLHLQSCYSQLKPR